MSQMNEIPTCKKWNTENGHSPVVNLANLFYPITEAAVKFIDENSFKLDIKKGKFLVKSGDICKNMYFIQKGVLRSYVKEGRKDLTTWIISENEIATSIKGFELQIPCNENIQALEDCELIAMGHSDIQFLYTNHLEMNIVGRKIYEQYYGQAEERAYISRIANAAARYNHFVKTRGVLINRIPLKYIASYLGMTMETLSRMRSKLVKKRRIELV